MRLKGKVAVITGATQSQRAGVAVILVFLIMGVLLLLPVREELRTTLVPWALGRGDPLREHVRAWVGP